MPNITLNTIYDRIVAREHPDATYTTTLFLEDAHIIAQDFWSDIQYMRKWDRNWDIWYADTVALQDEYTKPAPTSTSVWADWVESVSVTYESDTYTNTGGLTYIPCKKATIEQKKDWERLLEEQDRDQPIYFESDGSIFIAPEVRTGESGTNRLKITGVRSLASGSWTTSTSETDIKLPIFAFDVIYYGVAWKVNEFMQRDDNKIMAKYNFYVEQKRRAVMKMNMESSESYDNTNMSTREIEEDEIVIRTSW